MPYGHPKEIEMSEEKKTISVSDFMGGVSAAGEIVSEKRANEFNFPSENADDVIVPVKDLEEEEQKEIARELKKQESQVEIGDLEIRSLIGVLPLEPVIVMASLGQAESIGDLKSVGIPGYINPNSGEFFLLDGSVPESISLREKVKEYVENRG